MTFTQLTYKLKESTCFVHNVPTYHPQMYAKSIRFKVGKNTLTLRFKAKQTALTTTTGGNLLQRKTQQKHEGLK